MFPFIELMAHAVTLLSLAPMVDSPLLQLNGLVPSEVIKRFPQATKGSFFEYFRKPELIVPIPTPTLLLPTKVVPTPTTPYLDPYSGWPVRLVVTFALSSFLFGVFVCFILCMTGQTYALNRAEKMRLEDEEDEANGIIIPEDEAQDWEAVIASLCKAWTELFTKAVGCCFLLYIVGFYLLLLLIRFASPALTIDEYYFIMNCTDATPHDPIYAWAASAAANLSGPVLSAATTPFVGTEEFIGLYERAKGSLLFIAASEPASKLEADAIQAEAHFNLLLFLKAGSDDSDSISISDILESARDFRTATESERLATLFDSSTPTGDMCAATSALEVKEACGLGDYAYRYLIEPTMFTRLVINPEAHAPSTCSSATSLDPERNFCAAI
ncbi:hypothetical protein HGRIS_013759 [Hohenbuehelia grisea]|uniref:Uncharacterized protein n=1 Tax=Hohenbuehelia grisea TaxID=104357 RepID=A0ABR3IWG7_9AGAR